MKKINHYTVLDNFYKSDNQKIDMGIDENVHNDVVLINQIDKTHFIFNEYFDDLLTSLSNVVYSESSDNYILITRYNEGTPLNTYLSNYNLDDEHKISLFNDLLKKIKSYHCLPEQLINILVNANQMVVSKDEILLNEIIHLDRLNTASHYRESLSCIAQKMFANCQSSKCLQLLSYFNSNEYGSDNLNNIHYRFVTIIESPLTKQDKIKESIEGQSEKQALPFLLMKQTPDTKTTYKENAILNDKKAKVLDEKEVEKTIILESTAKIGAYGAYSKSEPTKLQKQPPKAKKKKSKKQRRMRILWLFLIFLFIFIISWLFQNFSNASPKIETPNLGFKVYTYNEGWMFENTTPLEVTKKYHSFLWTIEKDNTTIYTSQDEHIGFKPSSNGNYTVSLKLIDNNGNTTNDYSKVISFKNKKSLIITQPKGEYQQDKMIEPLNTDNQKAPPNATLPGDVYRDATQTKVGDASLRITKPHGQYYNVITLNKKAIANNDTLSFWLKSSNDKIVNFNVKTFKDDQLIYEKSFNFKPTISDFTLISHTFDKGGFNKINLAVKSLNDYIWIDGITVAMMK